MYDLSNKYIYIEEYQSIFSQSKYRNLIINYLKEILLKIYGEKYPDLKLIDYGFCWSEDPYYKKMSDNQTWFLFKNNLIY